jgi:cysteine desulfurase
MIVSGSKLLKSIKSFANFPVAYFSLAMETSTTAPAEIDLNSDSYSLKGKFISGRPAYLDFQATTPLDPRVLDAMLPYMLGKFGNPHSRTQ